MKIVYCIPSIYNSGGMERILADKANYMTEKFNYQVIIITTDQKEKKTFFTFNPKIKHFDLNINYSDSYFSPFYKKNIDLYIKRIQHKKKLKKLLNELKADIVISMFGSEVYFLPNIKDGSKKVLEIHFSKNFRLQHERSGIKNIIDRIRTKIDDKIIKKYNKFIVLTQEDAKNWRSSINLEVISNPYPFYPQIPSTLDSKIILSIGRLSGQKGYDRLILAWKNIHKAIPDWKLRIIGNDGGEKENLLKTIDHFELNDSIKLIEPTKDIGKEYFNSSIYVMTSRYEGMPLVLLEAMIYGIPCISFDCPCGPKEIINNGIDGYLIENDNIEELSKKIKELIINEDLRKEMGRKARINIQRYSPEKIMNQWDNLFKSLLDK